MEYQSAGLASQLATRACLIICFSIFFSSSTFSQVLTEHNDNSRSGANTAETRLTRSNVRSTTFGKLFSEPVDGYIVGQPLLVPAVQFPDGSTHDVVYVTTQHDSIYAFDANAAGTPIWQVSLTNPAAGITSVPISDYGCTGTGFTEVGIMGTPVIDPATSAMYLVAKTLENGAYVFRLHALSLATGQDVATPTVIAASAPSTKGTVVFNPAVEMQRTALLLVNGTLYFGFGSNGCDTFGYRGWFLAYNELNLAQSGVLLITPNGQKGGVWQGGGGAAADANGTIFVATGDGTFDANAGGDDWGDTFLHINPANSGFDVVDYFTPYNELSLFNQNLDIGSSGVLLLPDQSGTHIHELVGGGKEGTVYLVDRDNMGKYNATGDAQIVQAIPSAATELDGVPAYWNGNVYIAGNTDHVKAYGLSSGELSSTPKSQTSMTFNQAGPGSVSVSSNALNNGILWAILHGGSVSYLYAFNASNLATELYGSNQAAGGRDAIAGTAHFATPTIANGKVYIGGTSLLYVFGLLPSLSVKGGNNQSGYLGATLATPVSVLAKDTYTGKPIANVSLTCKDGGAGGSFSNPSPVTNAQGVASTNYTLPNKRATITITCSRAGFLSASFTEASTAGPASRVAVASGNNQVAPISSTLPQPLVATVYDSHSYAVSGVSVTFSDNGAGGTFSPATAVTGSNGQASATYTAPAKSGYVSVTASVPNLTPVTFKETAYGPSTHVVISSGNNQSGPASAQLPVALGVTVLDANNIPVPGVNVSFSDNGAGGKLSTGAAITGSSGKASTAYTTPSSTGTVYVSAIASGLPPAEFKITVN